MSTSPDPAHRAVRSVLRALLSGLEFLRLGHGDTRIVLTYKQAGEIIDDEECPELYRVLQTGVYRRFVSTRGTGTAEEVRSYRWLFLCPATEHDLGAALSHAVASSAPLAIEGMSVDAAWQKIQWDEAQERKARRDRRQRALADGLGG